MKKSIIILLLLILSSSVFAELTEADKLWNKTYYRLEKLADEELKEYLKSKDKNEVKASKIILMLRKYRREWEKYKKLLKKKSYEDLIKSLDSDNSTEIAVALSLLTIHHKNKKNLLIPLLVKYANRKKYFKIKLYGKLHKEQRTFIYTVESLTNKKFRANAETHDTYTSINLLNEWWKKNKNKYKELNKKNPQDAVPSP